MSSNELAKRPTSGMRILNGKFWLGWPKDAWISFKYYLVDLRF